MRYFLDYEKSEILKRLGFNEDCLALYKMDSARTLITSGSNAQPSLSNTKHPSYIAAPIIRQTLNWFIKEYELIGLVEPCLVTSEKKEDKYVTCPPRIEFTFSITTTDGKVMLSSFDQKKYLTYDEAEEACLDALFEKIKDE